MKSKQPNSNNFKVILISSCFFIFLLFLLLTSSNFPTNVLFNSSVYFTNSSHSTNQEPNCPDLVPTNFTKIPPSLANALVHYATSNTTPQQTIQEITLSLKVLQNKSPCNFLVFGLGNDSLLWTSLNHGGRTVFLEESKKWIEKMKKGNPYDLESYHVVYDTNRAQADELHDIGMQEHCKVVSDPRMSKCQLALKGMPSVVYDTAWDVIMVDAPTGFSDEKPGRMTAIYTAGLMARNKENGDTDVFVHDVDRMVEDKFSKSFLCEGYMIKQEGKIRHFNIPSHIERPFCP